MYVYVCYLPIKLNHPPLQCVCLDIYIERFFSSSDYLTLMSNMDLNGCKKRKRGDRVFKFKSFGENGYPVEFLGSSFRENVKALVEFGHLESNLCLGMLCWSFQLQVHRHPPLHILLFVVEESIDDASVIPHCQQCHFVGKIKFLFFVFIPLQISLYIYDLINCCCYVTHIFRYFVTYYFIYLIISSQYFIYSLNIIIII